jgi:tetratricopeptide (TPR) repeat protein
LQARYWEGQQQWQSSINEYQLAGEGTPTSENIARVNNEWGEQILSQQHYDVALAKFNIVLTNYGSASVGVARAQSDIIKAYLAWGQQASQQQDYTSAVSHYDTLLQLPYCTSDCQSKASSLDATAYYNLAESKLATQNYADAVNDFQMVVTRFSSSPEAQKLHQDYAKALFGHGQQQLTSATCSAAVPTYQQLSTQFADTSQGQQAAAALKLPQAVKGHFTSQVPNTSALTAVAALMHGLYPITNISSDGTFMFKPLPQQTYDLVWGTFNSANIIIQYIRSDGTVYEFTVGPLCTYDLGDISETIPIAP